MCVKFIPKNLNPNLFPSHLTNTFIYRVITALRVCDNLHKTYIKFINHISRWAVGSLIINYDNKCFRNKHVFMRDEYRICNILDIWKLIEKNY